MYVVVIFEGADKSEWHEMSRRIKAVKEQNLISLLKSVLYLKLPRLFHRFYLYTNGFAK